VDADLPVLYEHPDRQEPLFDALADRGLAAERLDLTEAVYAVDNPAPRAGGLQPGQPQCGCALAPARGSARASDARAPRAPRRTRAERDRRLGARDLEGHPAGPAARPGCRPPADARLQRPGRRARARRRAPLAGAAQARARRQRRPHAHGRGPGAGGAARPGARSGRPTTSCSSRRSSPTTRPRASRGSSTWTASSCARCAWSAARSACAPRRPATPRARAGPRSTRSRTCRRPRWRPGAGSSRPPGSTSGGRVPRDAGRATRRRRRQRQLEPAPAGRAGLRRLRPLRAGGRPPRARGAGRPSGTERVARGGVAAISTLAGKAL